MNKDKKFWAFQLNKTTIFEVEYYQLNGNQTPHFSTSAAEFNRPKTDWNRCGQAQEDLLPRNSYVYKFYKKWDVKHLQDLSNEEYAELVTDIKRLKNIYNYIELDQDEKLYRTYIPFWALKNLSMLKLPNKNNTPQQYKY